MDVERVLPHLPEILLCQAGPNISLKKRSVIYWT